MSTMAMHRRMAHDMIGRAVSADSATAVMREAGLDWTVGLEGMTTDSGLVVPKKYATVKTKVTLSEDGVSQESSVLGVVGSRYHVLQNAEIFTALDTLVDSGEARYTTAGELDGGAIVWTVMQLPREVQVANDPHAAHLLARTSHDGSSSLQIVPIVQRIHCTNQITTTIKKASSRYTLRHTIGSKINISQMREMLGVVYAEIEEYEQIAARLQQIKIADFRATELLNRIFPMPPKIEGRLFNMTSGERRQQASTLKKRRSTMSIYDGATGTQDEWMGTGYGLYQAVVEYADHFSGGSAAKRAERTFTGKTDALKARALETILAA